MSKALELTTDLPTENQIRNAIVEFLIYRGFLVIRINSGAAVATENGKRRFVSFVKWWAAGEGPQTAGVSDLLCFKPGQKPLAIETKRPGKTPTDAQRRFMEEWERYGGIALTACSVDDVIKALDESGKV